MADKSLVEAFPAEAWAAILASFSIIGTLVTVLYKRLNSDIKAHDTQLENGRKQFEEIGKELVKLGEGFKKLSEAGTDSDKEVEELWEAIENLKDRFQSMEIDCAKQHGGKITNRRGDL